MGLIRLGLFGAVAYGIYRYALRPKPVPRGTANHDGVAALFGTREQADLAIEHLVQQHGISRSAIFAEPGDERNTSGAAVSGGDAPSGDAGSRARSDAPLAGVIRLTVASSEHERRLVEAALSEAGALEVRTF